MAVILLVLVVMRRELHVVSLPADIRKGHKEPVAAADTTQVLTPNFDGLKGKNCWKCRKHSHSLSDPSN
jgi:hypothetical protein